MIAARILYPGRADGETLRLDEPLSFWGAFDPREGRIVDRHHPQCGISLTRRIVLLPETRGSGGTPGGLAESLRRGTGPAAIILIAQDVNLAVGAAVAKQLYGVSCPVLSVTRPEFDRLAAFQHITIGLDGTITGK